MNNHSACWSLTWKDCWDGKYRSDNSHGFLYERKSLLLKESKSVVLQIQLWCSVTPKIHWYCTTFTGFSNNAASGCCQWAGCTGGFWRRHDTGENTHADGTFMVLLSPLEIWWEDKIQWSLLRPYRSGPPPGHLILSYAGYKPSGMN